MVSQEGHQDRRLEGTWLQRSWLLHYSFTSLLNKRLCVCVCVTLWYRILWCKWTSVLHPGSGCTVGHTVFIYRQGDWLHWDLTSLHACLYKNGVSVHTPQANFVVLFSGWWDTCRAPSHSGHPTANLSLIAMVCTFLLNKQRHGALQKDTYELHWWHN